MIEGVTNANAIPVLEKLMQFSGQRQKLIVNNIANISTPDFRPMDLDVNAFRTALSEAVDRRRDRDGAAGGDLEIKASRQLRFTPRGLEIDPQAAGENILYHDGNDRNVERLMQDLVENVSTFRMAAEFMRGRFELINTAIRERI